MKVLFLLLLAAVNAEHFNEDDKMQHDLGIWTLQEISQRTHSDLALDDLVILKKTTAYNSASADNEYRVKMQMEATHRNDGKRAVCIATVSIPESKGKLSLNDFDCSNQDDNENFYKRSGETPCTSQERQEVGSEAEKLINQNVDQANEDLNFPGMLDLPELQQSHYSFGSITSCSKSTVNAGTQYTLSIDATQDEVDQTCNIKLIKGDDGSYDVTQNQCQGMN